MIFRIKSNLIFASRINLETSACFQKQQSNLTLPTACFISQVSEMPHAFPKTLNVSHIPKKYLNVSPASIVLSPQHGSPVIPFQLYNQPVLCFRLNMVFLQLYYYNPLFVFSPYLQRSLS